MGGLRGAKQGAGDLETGGEPDPGLPVDVRASGTVRRLGMRPGSSPTGVPDVPCADIHGVIRVYQRPVYRFVARAGIGEDTNDVVQEVFVAVDLYLRGHAMPKSARSLVFTIAWRKVLDHARGRRHREKRWSEVLVDEVPASRSTTEDRVDLKRTAEAAFATMSAEEVLMVREGVGDSDEHGALTETAERIGIDPSTLRSRASRARARFVAALERIYKKDPGDRR